MSESQSVPLLLIGVLTIVLRITVVTSIQSNQINELFMEVILIKKENENLKEKI